jgi:hypothetical protein
MPKLAVTDYALAWGTQNKQGTIRLALEDGQAFNITVPSAEELAALAAVLNESPVFYRTEDGVLLTGKEPVGGT